jgi:hypothetical protein
MMQRKHAKVMRCKDPTIDTFQASLPTDSRNEQFDFGPPPEQGGSTLTAPAEMSHACRQTEGEQC